MSSRTFYLVSLGCSKNTVDSHSMAQLLAGAGYRAVDEAKRAEVIIANTCGFIGPAREESLATLRQLAAQKRQGQVLIAAGCLTQRYGLEVARQVPGLDGILGTRRWMDIVEVVRRVRPGKHPRPFYHLPESPTSGAEAPGVLRAALQGASAYLKIADGCRRPCAFCAIPSIKGPAISQPMEAILEEARLLQERGARELVLIAQDTTDYGHDLGVKDGLALLLEKMAETLASAPAGENGRSPGVAWIRLMYAYPGCVSDRLIEVMASHPQIVPYLDIPLQHAHPAILRAMRRPANMERVQRALEKMRALLPGLALRTTFIVGYPGEGEAEFRTLLDFIRTMQFDRAGAFQFSFEPGTASEALGDPIPPQVKQERWERLMELQQGISLQKNQAFVGSRLETLIEGYGDGFSLGRTYRDAPEVDGMVFVEGKLPLGEMVTVSITGAMTYDLTGKVADGRIELHLEGASTFHGDHRPARS